jgi:surfactin synthase thioesterase subunit
MAMAAPIANRSLKCFHPRPDAQVLLFCFPWAGVGASAFYSWSRYLPGEVELTAVQYPGREDRLGETALRRLSLLRDLLMRDLASHCDRAFAFLGHSMGALVAFELARGLVRAGLPAPGHLFVSGRQAPQLPEPMAPIPDLPDAEFVAELQQRYGGVPEAIARDPEMRAIFLPAIRADLELVHAYTYEPGPALGCGISALGGTEDRIGREHLEGWRVQTRGPFRLDLLSGDHFFIAARTEEVVRRVTEDMRAAFPLR